MRQSVSSTYENELEPVRIDRDPWMLQTQSVEVHSGAHSLALQAAMLGGGLRDQAYVQKLVPGEEVSAQVFSLSLRLRELHERCEEERKRLSDALSALSAQSRNLERELAVFGGLTHLLDVPTVAPSTSPAHLPQATPEVRGTAQLQVRLLGGFELRYEGCPLGLGSSRNGRLVFKYLATKATGCRASKELLAELLWPEAPLERSLPNLQAAVYQVKRAAARQAPELLESPLLVFAHDQYGINPELRFSSDVDLFRDLSRRARLYDARGQTKGTLEAYLQAEQAYGGELLPEERYEDWVLAERASLNADYLEVLARILRIYMDGGGYQRGITVGRKLLEEDRTREDVHRDLMRCFSRSGSRCDALRQFHRCAEALQEELEIEPEGETIALFESLSRGEPI